MCKWIVEWFQWMIIIDINNNMVISVYSDHKLD